MKIAITTLLLLSVPLFASEASAEVASFYSYELAGNPTASGDIFEPEGFTAASNVYPLGTHLLVCYDECVEVVVNDRGPFVPGRDIDLSLGAARAIGMVDEGVAEVEVL